MIISKNSLSSLKPKTALKRSKKCLISRTSVLKQVGVLKADHQNSFLELFNLNFVKVVQVNARVICGQTN